MNAMIDVFSIFPWHRHVTCQAYAFSTILLITFFNLTFTNVSCPVFSHFKRIFKFVLNVSFHIYALNRNLLLPTVVKYTKIHY